MVCRDRYSVEVGAGDVSVGLPGFICGAGLCWWADGRGGYGRYSLHEPCKLIHVNALAEEVSPLLVRKALGCCVIRLKS